MHLFSLERLALQFQVCDSCIVWIDERRISDAHGFSGKLWKLS